MGDSQDESERRIAGPVVIEVEKAKVMDSSDLPVGEVSKQDVSMEKTTMIQVGEGEVIETTCLSMYVTAVCKPMPWCVDLKCKSK